IVYAVDVSAEALNVAAQNAAHHGLGNRIRFLQGNLLEPLPEPVDLLLANLPYVASADFDRLAPESRDHEPRLALLAGVDGLDLIRRVIVSAPGKVTTRGAIYLEVGHGQSHAVAALARESFLAASVTSLRDLAGVERVVLVDLAETSADPQPDAE